MRVSRAKSQRPRAALEERTVALTRAEAVEESSGCVKMHSESRSHNTCGRRRNEGIKATQDFGLHRVPGRRRGSHVKSADSHM